MMSLFSPLHAIAARRGEGLRPELVRLLECSKLASEASKREGDEVDIFLGSFDRPGEIPVPTRQIWTQRRIPWVPEMTHIRTYLRSPRE
jgi:hypothetical protein